eukprot:Gb_17180 [translate_table: standard]
MKKEVDSVPVNDSGINHFVEYDDEENFMDRRRSLSRDSYASDEMRHPIFASKGSVDGDKVHKVDVGCKPKPKLEPVKHMIGYDFDADENDSSQKKAFREKEIQEKENWGD